MKPLKICITNSRAAAGAYIVLTLNECMKDWTVIDRSNYRHPRKGRYLTDEDRVIFVVVSDSQVDSDVSWMEEVRIALAQMGWAG